jgi:hypothetical protein
MDSRVLAFNLEGWVAAYGSAAYQGLAGLSARGDRLPAQTQAAILPQEEK